MPQPMVVDTPFRSEERFTQQEFFAWLQRRPASDLDHDELIRGRIVTSPPAGWPHGFLGSRIGARLSSVVEQHDVGIVPNLAVEILSRSTARRDRTEKKAIYQQCGVGEYWIVDPDRKTVTLFHLADGRYADGERGRSGAIRSRVLPQLELTVEDLFAA